MSMRRKQKLASRDGGARCHYCGCRRKLRRLTIDHVIPRSRGGSRRALANLVLACQECNNAKGDLPPEAFAAGVRWWWAQ